MVDVCLTAIGIIQVILRGRRIHTVADDLPSIDAVLSLAATLSSCFALRARFHPRLHWLERIADATFLVA